VLMTPRRGDANEVQAAIHFLRDGIRGLGRVGMDAAGRRDEEHEGQRRPAYG